MIRFALTLFAFVGLSGPLQARYADGITCKDAIPSPPADLLCERENA